MLALSKQIANILQTTIAQNEADRKFSDGFSADEGFKKYLVSEAAIWMHMNLQENLT